MSRTNYYLNDLALQERMYNIMRQLIDQFPYTHESQFGGTYGGFPAIHNRKKKSSPKLMPVKHQGGKKHKKRMSSRHMSMNELMGGEDRNMDRPNGQREIGRWDYGGAVESKNPYLDFLRGHPGKRKRLGAAMKGSSYSGGKKRRGAGTSGGKVSKWIKHVKAYAKKHNVSYRQAMSEAKSSYHG